VITKHEGMELFEGGRGREKHIHAQLGCKEKERKESSSVLWVACKSDHWGRVRTGRTRPKKGGVVISGGGASLIQGSEEKVRPGKGNQQSKRKKEIPPS